MPLLEGEEKPGAGGIDILTLDKPAPGKMIVKSFSIFSLIAGTDFLSAYACFQKTGKAGHRIPLGTQICQVVSRGGLHWELNREWPAGFQFHIDYYAQAAGTWYWVLEYELIEEDPRKKRWGE